MTSLPETPNMNELIRAAFEVHGFTANIETGQVFNAQGLELVHRISAINGHPRVRLPHPKRRRFEFKSARVIGWLTFGDIVFKKGFSVAHVDGNITNNKASNLCLVTDHAAYRLSKIQQKKRYISRFSALTKRLRPGTTKRTQEPPMSSDLAQFLVEQRQRERTVFNRLKSDFHLRLMMLPLVEGLRELIDDCSFELMTFKSDDVDPFEQDDFAQRLLVLLTEFLSGDSIDTPEGFDQMVHVGQLTPVHIAAHLNLNVTFFSGGDWLVHYAGGKSS